MTILLHWLVMYSLWPRREGAQEVSERSTAELMLHISGTDAALAIAAPTRAAVSVGPNNFIKRAIMIAGPGIR